jgi:hypothetical protein
VTRNAAERTPAWIWAVLFVGFPHDPAGVSRPRAENRNARRESASLGVLPDDLYIQIESWRRIGRSPKRDLETWRVIDDWPARVPVTEAQIDIFEARFGDLFESDK